ncbi:hypothetical protein GCM10010965_04980 [Caldalkalibacillus thermarum]|uniref:hypothetical protein n=1 Tax=Caldalkalibacillus thermarum TaxID=296745 RepID=UPI0019A5E3AB|nr:hypothetical protein GCM10010965_04980 [Caldalkalibacillus thermarum]
MKELISGKTNRKFIHEGKPEEGFGWAGQVIGLIHDIPTVQELFERMEEEARTYLAQCRKVLDEG